MTPQEAQALLGQVREALKYYLENFHNTKESGRIGFEAAQALDQLSAYLEELKDENKTMADLILKMNEENLRQEKAVRVKVLEELKGCEVFCKSGIPIRIIDQKIAEAKDG